VSPSRRARFDATRAADDPLWCSPRTRTNSPLNQRVEAQSRPRGGAPAPQLRRVHPSNKGADGAVVPLHPEADYDFHPLEDGGTLEFGDVRLEVLETPGHTPESISIVVFDLASDPRRPHAVLTGDTLFIGDVGRPDLLASVGVTAESLAGMLYDSLHRKLMTLPADTLLYPGHGAGSACGKNLSVETVSTIGAQHAQNYALQPMSRQEFVRRVVADQPEAPAYFRL
jgi:glyoxylase-like metal-dependent hydrolase (beta-lactamase superfamily II)